MAFKLFFKKRISLKKATHPGKIEEIQFWVASYLHDF